MMEQIGKGYQGIRAIEAFEHLSMNKQEVTSNVVIPEKKWKTICQTTVSIPGTKGAFSDKVAPDIDDFDEPEF